MVQSKCPNVVTLPDKKGSIHSQITVIVNVPIQNVASVIELSWKFVLTSDYTGNTRAVYLNSTKKTVVDTPDNIHVCCRSVKNYHITKC